MRNALLALLIVCSAATADAGVFINLVTSSGFGNDTKLTDESREVFVDNGDNVISTGDIVYGWIKISDPSSVEDFIYAAFSQTFFVDPGAKLADDGNARYTGSMTATVAGPYSLSSLTGDAVDARALFAVYEASSAYVDLLTSPDGAAGPPTGTTQDGIDYISGNGNFLFSGGFRDLGPTGDFFTWRTNSQFGFPAATDPFLVPGAYALLVNQSNIGTFTGGLSILDNNSGAVFGDTITSPRPPSFGPSTYELVITDGNFGGVGQTPNVPSDAVFVDKANFFVNVRSIVPEATSIVAWAVLGIVGIAVSVVRKRK